MDKINMQEYHRIRNMNTLQTIYSVLDNLVADEILNSADISKLRQLMYQKLNEYYAHHGLGKYKRP